MAKRPWHHNTHLTEERLVTMASFIASVRSEVIDLHDDELGDTRLSTGMRAYEVCRTRINKLADSKEFSWLHKLTPNGRFTFAIGSVPVRFSRNVAEELPNRKLVVSDDAQWQMNLLEVEPHEQIRWFFVFDTEFDSAADNVYFVGYTEFGEIVCQWEVPIEIQPITLSLVGANSSAAVELPKPKVVVKRIIESEDEDAKDLKVDVKTDDR